MESLSEILLNIKEPDNNFDSISFFCENKILDKIIVLSKNKNKEINLKIIKYLSIIISNSSNKSSNFNFFDYLCNNNYLNQIIYNLNYNIEEHDDDYSFYYISFLKAISNKVNKSNLKLMLHHEYNMFPLLDQVLILLNNEDIMIRNSARNIFLSLIKINNSSLIEYLCGLPRISIFVILVQKINSYILLLISLKNNNNSFYFEKTQELKEKIIEDFLFIQDILSINIYKINYILLNCLFSIIFLYLFRKIISFSNNKSNLILKSEISKSINVLRIILKNIKCEIIKNIICFILYSEKVFSQVNEFLVNKDFLENKECKMENLRLLNLNFSNLNYNYSKIKFEDYIILNYSYNFFKSIKHINQFHFYEELNDIYNSINTNNNVEENKNLFVKILNEKYFKDKNMIKIMYNYHFYLSRITGINCGIISDFKNNSFLNILYYNFLIIQSKIMNNDNFNDYYKDNILRKEILFFLKNEIENNNHLNTILNIIVLLIQIIDDKDISEKLKQLLNIKIKGENNKNINDKINININTIDNEEKVINYIKEISNNEKEIIYPDKIPEPKNIVNKSNLKDDNSEDISIKEDISNYKNFNYDNNFYLTITTNYKYFNKNDEIILYIFDFIFSPNYNIDNNSILLCFNLIENLMIGIKELNDSINTNIKKIFDSIDLYYLETLKQIKQILLKNTKQNFFLNSRENINLKNEIVKFSYGLFEECFYLNKKDINELINNYYSNLYTTSYVIIEKSDIYEEKLKIKNLFQKFIYLHDLKIICKENYDENLLFKNMNFPLDLIKNKLFEIGGKLDLKEYELKTIEVNFYKNFNMKNYDLLNEEILIMFIYNNYLFFALSPENIGLFDINSLDNEDYSFIKYKYTLRNIILEQNVENNELLISFLNDNSKMKILLKFKNNILFNDGKELIINGIKESILLEYSSIYSFINNYIENFSNIHL